PQHRLATAHRGRDPRADLERAGVVPQPAVEVAEVGGRHPPRGDADVPIRADPTRWPRGTIERDRGPGSALDGPDRHTRAGARPTAVQADGAGGAAARRR